MPRSAFAAIVLSLLIASFAPVQAQENLLVNPGFNTAGTYNPSAPYYRGDFSFANGWNGWQTNSPSTAIWQNTDSIAFPHTGEFVIEGDASQNIGRGDATFTAAAYQEVFNVAEGTTLRATARVYQDNNSGDSDARTRIGIGSNVQGNPLAGEITWSQWARDRRGWATISVEATVPAGSVTVFIYSTQSLPASSNQVYYDDAELVVTGAGEVNIGDGSGSGDESDNVVPPPPTSPPQVFAPFVSAQNADDSGRIEHTVRSGDTLAAIAVAYGVPVSEIRELNNLAGSNLSIGDVLLIQEAAPPTAIPEVTAAPIAENPSEPDNTDVSEDTSTSETTSPDTNTVSEKEAAQSASFATGASDNAADDTVSDDMADDMVSDDMADDTASEQTVEDPAPEPTVVAQVQAEPTNVPPTANTVFVTPTPPEPAPVESGADADPLSTEAEVCVTLFDDLNQNRIQDLDESLLGNGIVQLVSETSGTSLQYTTDGLNEPYCFQSLEPDNYTISATAPDGYGITTAPRLMLNAQPGQRLQLAVGAAIGVEPVIIPTTDSTTLTDNAGTLAPTTNDPSNLRNIAGLLVLGLAGVVLVGGIGVALFARRL